jgi:hypothetical protein
VLVPPELFLILKSVIAGQIDAPEVPGSQMDSRTNGELLLDGLNVTIDAFCERSSFPSFRSPRFLIPAPRDAKLTGTVSF